MIDTLRLREEAQSCGISLEQETAEKLDIYARLLVEWNEKMNLTAITAPGEIVTKHFVDSLTVEPCCLRRGKSRSRLWMEAQVQAFPVYRWRCGGRISG